jgi:hypothetical protein
MKYIGKYFSAERFSTYYCMLKCKYSVYCIYIVHQRTVLGLAPPMAGHGCQRYFGKVINQTM